MSETKQHPTPWGLDAPYPEMANRIVDANGFDLVDLGPGPYVHGLALDIVRAVNAHDELIAALQKIASLSSHLGRHPFDYEEIARAALAKATS